MSEVGRSPSGRATRASTEPQERLGHTASVPNAHRSISIYEKPLPARVVLARAMGLSLDEAGLALSALIEGGYGIAPRMPTNGMLAAYIEATVPAKHHKALITAIAKARLRWQAMLEQGTAMAMSLKYAPDDLQASAIEARRAETTKIGSVHESAIGNAETPKGPAHDQ